MTDEREWLGERFEEERGRLRGVAYRMLGSFSEAEDAVQEAWLRLNRTEPGSIENLSAWLTTVVSRVCLNVLRARRVRREEPFDAHVPDPIVEPERGGDPEQEALLADSVGLALLVVLDTLSPAERLAFVLHDTFGVPFEDIAVVLNRTPAAARQLASRARRRVQSATVPDTDLRRQREVVDAFLAASHEGDFEGLLAVLDPDVAVRADGGAALAAVTNVLRGARVVAGQAFAAARLGLTVRPALVNGAAGLVSWDAEGRPFSVMSFTVVDGRIVEIDVLLDPERLGRLELEALRGHTRRLDGDSLEVL